MLSIAVCDDEIIQCCNLAKMVQSILEEMKIPFIIQQFGSGKALLQEIENFDIIFLDIIMHGMNGMETATLFRKKHRINKILIFISSSKEYVFEAYDVEAFQYLIKPIKEEKLKKVLQRAVLKVKEHSDEYLIVSKERQKRKLFLDDIYYFEIKGRMIFVHGAESIFDYYGKIGILEEQLKEKGFFRCHKSYLINLNYVDTYNRKEVFLDNGECIMVAKRRYEAFCKEIFDHMRKNGGIL